MSDSSNPIITGFDGGGTGCRAAVGTKNQGVLGIAEGGPANSATNPDLALKNIVTTIDAAAQAAGIDPVCVKGGTAHLGLAGIMTPADSVRVQTALPYATCTVTDDRLTAVTGALGDNDGFLVSAGTGTFLAVKRETSVRYVGGWGFGLGDQGAGAWLGRNALERVLLCHDGLAQHSDLTRQLLKRFDNDPYVISAKSTFAEPKMYGALAPDIVDAAKAGDPHGTAILNEGASYLANGLLGLGFKVGDKLCLTGGLGPHYAHFLPQDILTNRVMPEGTGLDGAFLLARNADHDATRHGHEHN